MTETTPGRENRIPASVHRLFASLKHNKEGIILVVLTWLAFFSRTIVAHDVYFLDDLKILYYPLEQAYATAQAQWSLPQWDPTFGFGQPLLGWGQLGFFTPLHILLRFLHLHPLTLLQTSIITYFGIGISGMFLALRKLQFNQYVAALGALLFAFNGFNVGHLNHVNFYTATMLLPWLLLSSVTILKKPTVINALSLSAVTTSIILSGQPQVVSYTLAIGALFGIITASTKLAKPHRKTFLTKTLPLILLAAIITLAISTISILPLAEFLPLTERNEDLATEQLYEFSYPPWDTITLIAPYFFGDHSTYWGPKGFQELAAYVGILPLLLAGSALINWKDHRTERITACILIALGICFALGKNSALYVYLVERHLWPAFSVPGRFVYFFVVGVTFLACCGLNDFLKRPQPGRAGSAGLLGAAAILAPFFWYTQNNPTVYNRLQELLTLHETTLWLSGVGLLLFIGGIFISAKFPQLTKPTALAIVALAGTTMVVYGWNYNPLTPKKIAYAPSPITHALQQAASPLPPRLYSHETLLTDTRQSAPRQTDPLSPTFTIYQPFTALQNNLNCIEAHSEFDRLHPSTIDITLRENMTDQPLQEVHITTDKLDSQKNRFCFTPIPDSEGKNYIISFSSAENSGTRLFTTKNTITDQQAYFVRVQTPTPEQLEQSRKPVMLVFNQQFTQEHDTEAALLARHLNSTAGASSARWIGALSIKPYRQFIEQFFANDNDEVFDGDGKHAIQRNHKLFDMAGVTHFTQSLTLQETDDIMVANGFERVVRESIGTEDIALYKNPTAYPKAFVVPTGIFKPGADETRFAMLQEEFDPQEVVYIDGPTPPENLPKGKRESLTAQAQITTYAPTNIAVTVTTSQDAILVLTDATTPQWHTWVDNQKQNYLVANSLFKTALIPQGTHTVQFRYQSTAIQQGKMYASIGLAIAGALLLLSGINTLQQRISINSKHSTPHQQPHQAV